MEDKSIFVLGVALLTWGGVFFYLLRLSALAARLERELSHLEQEREVSNTSVREVESEVIEGEIREDSVRTLPPR